MDKQKSIKKISEFIKKLLKQYLEENNAKNQTGNIIIDNLSHFDHWVLCKLYTQLENIEKKVEELFSKYEFCIHCGDKCEDDNPCYKQETLDNIQAELKQTLKAGG